MKRPSRPITTVDLGSLREPLLAACRDRGISPSEAIRSLVAQSLATGPKAVLARENPGGRELRGLADSGTRRVEIRLTNSEHDLAKGVAAADGFALARWVAALVRCRLGGGPQLGERELQALATSSYQLRAIGRNLNQITRAINADIDPNGRDRLEIVGDLAERIDEHIGSVRRVLESNIERWKLGPS